MLYTYILKYRKQKICLYLVPFLHIFYRNCMIRTGLSLLLMLIYKEKMKKSIYKSIDDVNVNKKTLLILGNNHRYLYLSLHGVANATAAHSCCHAVLTAAPTDQYIQIISVAFCNIVHFVKMTAWKITVINFFLPSILRGVIRFSFFAFF